MGQVCRSCLTVGENFNHFLYVDVAPEIYCFCTSIQINEDDLSKSLCDNCYALIMKYTEFKKTCIESHKVLQSFTTKLKNVPTNSEIQFLAGHQNNYDNDIIFVVKNILEPEKIELDNSPDPYNDAYGKPVDSPRVSTGPQNTSNNVLEHQISLLPTNILHNNNDSFVVENLDTSHSIQLAHIQEQPQISLIRSDKSCQVTLYDTITTDPLSLPSTCEQTTVWTAPSLNCIANRDGRNSTDSTSSQYDDSDADATFNPTSPNSSSDSSDTEDNETLNSNDNQSQPEQEFQNLTRNNEEQLDTTQSINKVQLTTAETSNREGINTTESNNINKKNAAELNSKEEINKNEPNNRKKKNTVQSNNREQINTDESNNREEINTTESNNRKKENTAQSNNRKKNDTAKSNNKEELNNHESDDSREMNNYESDNSEEMHTTELNYRQKTNRSKSVNRDKMYTAESINRKKKNVAESNSREEMNTTESDNRKKKNTVNSNNKNKINTTQSNNRKKKNTVQSNNTSKSSSKKEFNNYESDDSEEMHTTQLNHRQKTNRSKSIDRDKIYTEDSINRDEMYVPEPITHKSTRTRNRSFCFFCDTDVLNFARHILRQHKTEPEVQKILSYPKKSITRKDLLTALRKKGNYITNVISCNKPMRKSNICTVSDYLPCENCLGFYSRRQLWKHKRTCQPLAETTNTQAKAQNFLLRNLSIDKKLKEEVFPKMRPDNVSLVAKKDSLIREYGSRYIRLHQEKHKINVTSRKMRELAKLLIEVRKIKPSIKDLTDCLKPKHYDIIVIAAKKLSSYDNKTDLYQVPTYAMNIGTSLKQCCKIALTLLRKSSSSVKSDVLESDFTTLIDVIQENWGYDVSDQAFNDMNVRKSKNKVTVIPLESDLKILKNYLCENAKIVASKLVRSKTNNLEAYNSLLEIIYCRILIFNGRRHGELQTMLLSTYQECNSGIANAYEEFDRTVSESDKLLIKSFKRMVIRGESGRGVPVLLTNEIQSDIDLLISLRAKYILSENNYLFAKSGCETPLCGYKVLEKYATACGAKNPKAITATKLRKYLITLTQMLDLTDSDIEQLSNFMGQRQSVNNQNYKLPEDVYQMAKISKLLLLMENSKSDKTDTHKKSLEEIELDSEQDLLENGRDENNDDNDLTEFDDEIPSKQPRKTKLSDKQEIGNICDVSNDILGGDKDLDETDLRLQGDLLQSTINVNNGDNNIADYNKDIPTQQPRRTSPTDKRGVYNNCDVINDIQRVGKALDDTELSLRQDLLQNTRDECNGDNNPRKDNDKSSTEQPRKTTPTDKREGVNTREVINDIHPSGNTLDGTDSILPQDLLQNITDGNNSDNNLAEHSDKSLTEHPRKTSPNDKREVGNKCDDVINDIHRGGKTIDETGLILPQDLLQNTTDETNLAEYNDKSSTEQHGNTCHNNDQREVANICDVINDIHQGDKTIDETDLISPQDLFENSTDVNNSDYNITEYNDKSPTEQLRKTSPIDKPMDETVLDFEQELSQYTRLESNDRNDLSECDDEVPTEQARKTGPTDEREVTNTSDAINPRRFIRKEKRRLVPWLPQQKKVVLEFFSKHIKCKQPPKRRECEELRDKYPDLLHNKDWLKMKVFVQNTYRDK